MRYRVEFYPGHLAYFRTRFMAVITALAWYGDSMPEIVDTKSVPRDNDEHAGL